MAERRMFAKTIVTSDAFLDMPASTRCLYFMLAMMADDDGFVNSPRSVMRQAGATLDDMNILIAKRFILTFESGVIVIKHWKIHNLIKGDRYKETTYLTEKSMLALDENKAYTEVGTKVEPNWNQVGTKVEPQDRRGKGSIVEVSLVKDSLEEEDASSPSFPSSVEKTVDNSYYTVKPIGGTLGKGVVKLSEYQIAQLLDKLSTENFDKYCDIVAEAELSGKKYTKKSHYQAILDMAMQDGVLRWE